MPGSEIFLPFIGMLALALWFMLGRVILGVLAL